MNIYQKIIYNKSGLRLNSGESTLLNLDWVMVHDGSILMVERYYKQYSFKKVFNPDKIIVVFDHIFPANNSLTANLHEKARNFVKEHNISHFFDGGNGISHQLLLESNEIQPGDLLLGGDSHTPTIGAYSVMGLGAGATDMTYAMLSGKMWFTMGMSIKIKFINSPSFHLSAKDVVLYIAKTVDVQRLHDKYIVYETEYPLSDDWRAVICNMSPELGAVTSLFEVNEEAIKNNQKYSKSDLELSSDSDKDFDDIIIIDLSLIVPLIAIPHDLRKIVPSNELLGIKVNVVFIGTCTGGRLEDLSAVAKVFREMKRPLKTRLLINPASITVYKNAIDQGLIKEFVDLGATILPPSCGPCLGQNMGVLSDNEVCVSTANRNYKGRMGNKSAFIYLCSPATAAYAAINGEI